MIRVHFCLRMKTTLTYVISNITAIITRPRGFFFICLVWVAFPMSVTGDFAVGVAQGDVLMSWRTNLTDISNFRFVANPSGANIIRFNPYNISGTAVPGYSSKVTDIGNVSLGIISFRLLSLTVADAGRYFFKDPSIASADEGQVLAISGDFAVGKTQGDVLMSWRTNLTDISNYRFVVNPNGTNIIRFPINNVTGTAVPNYRSKVTDIGNVSLGTVSFRLLNLTVADAGRYYYRAPTIDSADEGQVLVIAGDFAVGVAQRDVLMSWRTYLMDISNYRVVVNPNGANIIRFPMNNVTGTAVPGYSSKVTDIGNVSLGTVSFRLLNLTAADAGRYYYKLVPSNSDEGGQFLVIAGVPANISVTEVADPLENEKYAMQCSAQSTSVPHGMGLTMHYQWKRENGQNITMSDRYSYSSDQSNLFINPLMRPDAGTFICESWEHVGAVSTSAPFSLKVIYGPDPGSIHLSPNSISHELTESSSLSVNCSADCFPDCQYTWTGQGGNIVSSADLLSFISIGRNQTGQYTCTALNSRSPIKTATAAIIVTVFYGPDDRNVSLSPSNTSYQLTELSRLDIKCSATCEPQCNYQWSGPGLVSQNNSMGWLSISHIQRNQNGTFICTVTNPKIPGKSATANFSVIVYYAFDVLVNYSGSSLANSTVLLMCIASGEPSQYTFQEWIHRVGETEIRRLTGENTDNTSTLTLPNISIEDMGTYVCTVDISITGQNGRIKQTGYTDIYVHGTLFIENTNSMFIGMINKSARIEVPFYSNPSSTTVKFYRGANTCTVEVTNTSDTLIFLSSFLNTFTFHGKEVLLNGQSAVLHFRMVKLTEYGEYTAVLFNDNGSTSRHILFSSGKPEIPAKFHITDVQENQVILQWLSGDHRGFDQTFVIQISIDNNTWTNASLINAGKKEGWFSATVTGLKSNTVYYFRLYSFNVNGGSGFADTNFATKTLKEYVSSLDIGGSIGIGFGGFFLGVVGTISVIIIWKRITTKTKYCSSSEADMSTDMQTYANTGASSLPAPSHYEQLQQDRMEKTMYDHI